MCEQNHMNNSKDYINIINNRYVIAYIKKDNYVYINNRKIFSFLTSSLLICKYSDYKKNLVLHHNDDVIFFNRSDIINFISNFKVDIKKSCNSKDYVIQPCESESDYEKIFFIIKKNTFCIEENKILLMYLLFFMSKNIFFNQFIINTIKVNTKDMVKIIIKRNLSVDVNMYSVSKELCISTSLLKKKLNKENISYSQILLDCKMEKAKELLLYTHENISGIAKKAGYNSVSYFISVFVKYYGITPYKYRMIFEQNLVSKLEE